MRGRQIVAAKRKSVVAAPQSLQMGAYAGHDPADLARFQTWLGRPVDHIPFYGGEASWSDFSGSIGYAIDLMSGFPQPIFWSIPLLAGDTTTLEQAAAGNFNAYYLDVAQQIEATRPGDPIIYIRCAWEFNGDWMKWAAAGKETAFIGAWRQFVNTFRQAGSRFKFEWNINIGENAMAPPDAWPGDAYVDIVGVDFYYDLVYDDPDPATAFYNNMRDGLYGLTWIRNFANTHGKLMGVSEWGVERENAGAFVTLVKDWMVANNVSYHNYWDINEDINCLLSDGSKPLTGAAFISAFGPTTTPVANPGNVVLTELPANRVYQRSGTTSSIPLSGTYSGNPAPVQARVVDATTAALVQDWTTISTTPSGGTWAGSLTAPQGGWYKVEVRFQGGSTTTTANRWGVGDIWLFAGQSQQARMSTLVSAAPTANAKTVYFVSGAWSSPSSAQSTGGNGGIEFMNLMTTQTGVPQAMIQTAVESTSITDWEPGDSAYENAVAQLSSVGSVAGVLWHQGGTGVGIVSKANYKTRLASLRSGLESAGSVLRFGVYPLMYRTTATDTDIAVQETRQAHYEYIAENPPTVNLGWAPVFPMADEVHQTAAGSLVIARAYAHSLLHNMGVIATSSLGPIVTGVTRSGTTLTLAVSHTGGTSLKTRTGTAATGFQVLPRGAAFSDASALPISSITLGTNTITIVLASDPAQAVDVYYQYGKFDNTSAVFDNTSILSQDGVAMRPLMAPVQSASEVVVPPVDPTNALSFNGTTGYVSYGDTDLWTFPDADWTFGMMMKINSNAGTISQYIVSTGGFGAANAFNFLAYETGAGAPAHAYEANLAGLGIQGPAGNATLTNTDWRLWTVERIKSTGTLNIYYTPINGVRTLYHTASVAAMTSINGSSAPLLGTRSPVTAGNERWFAGSIASIFKMNGTLTAAETQAVAAGQDLVAGVGKSPMLYTKLNTLTSPIANSGTGGAAPAAINGGVTLVAGPTF